MNNEFKKDDVVVEIWDCQEGCWVVRDVSDENYYFDVVKDGRRRVTTAWCPIEYAHNTYVKVGRWDDKNKAVVSDD